VVFDQCRVPADQLLIDAGGFKDLISAFNIQRCMNASISLGLAEGALEESIRYMRNREAYEQRIGDFQGMRWKVSEMYRDIEASRSLLYRACASADPFPDPVLAALAKMTCNQMSLRVTSEAVQIHGGYGFVEEFLVARQYCCARYGSLGGVPLKRCRTWSGAHWSTALMMPTGYWDIKTIENDLNRIQAGRARCAVHG